MNNDESVMNHPTSQVTEIDHSENQLPTTVAPSHQEQSDEHVNVCKGKKRRRDNRRLQRFNARLSRRGAKMDEVDRLANEHSSRDYCNENEQSTVELAADVDNRQVLNDHIRMTFHGMFT
jgi:hypothetical protein